MTTVKTEAAFTPGPWGYQPKIPGAKMWFFIVGNREGNNAEVDIGDVRGGIPTAEANARLIAAGPCLYEALVEAREKIAEWVHVPEWQATLAKIDAALANARGDAPPSKG